MRNGWVDGTVRVRGGVFRNLVTNEISIAALSPY